MNYMSFLNTFNTPVRAAVIGASGGIGQAFCTHLESDPNIHTLYKLSRSGKNHIHINLTQEETIARAAEEVGTLDMVIVATGLLHEGALQPEKAFRDLTAENFKTIFEINTLGPALLAKYFIPLLPKDARGVFAALSARVGSISDNGLGGWTSYRASKAALNMVLKNAAIEAARTHKQAVIAGLHPGTVDTGLSKPFQGFVKPGKLFTAKQAAGGMLGVLDGLTPAQSGKVFAYDGQEIVP